MRLASEAAARFDSYVELLCLEAVDRVVVEYFDVSVGWVQQQQQQLEQHEQFEQQQQLELQQLVQRQRKKLKVKQNNRTGRDRCGCWRILGGASHVRSKPLRQPNFGNRVQFSGFVGRRRV